MNKAELLAPVGKMENAIAAIENGADALFVGGKLFNARQAADNFTQDELEEIVCYAKLRGVKVYVTVNILVKEMEMPRLYHELAYLEKIGVDAIIVQDLGVARLARRYFPKLRLHASTQMSAHSLEDVLFLKEEGFKRVVLARELQLEEIKYIVQKAEIEIECFVHGALCYSYSGQCLMSSLIGARSGNRGRCAQPCRMKYRLQSSEGPLTKETYLLSLKDICTIEFLPQLLEAGIFSFKVEGRMKSPEYVASVMQVYRKYIDLAGQNKAYQVEEKDRELLKGIFNRGGFSKGYYFEKGSPKMLTPDSPRHIGLLLGEVTHYNPKSKTVTLTLMRELHAGDGIEVIREGKESVGTGIDRDYQAGSQLVCRFKYPVAVKSKVYLTKNHQLLKAMRQTYQKQTYKNPLTIQIEGYIGKPLKLTLSCQGKTIVYKGMCVEKAVNAPLSKLQVQKQLTKLGNTPFEARQVQIEWDEEGYLPVSVLNAARREAVKQLQEQLLKVEMDEFPKDYQKVRSLETQKAQTLWCAEVTTLSQLKQVLQYSEIEAIYWKWQYDDEMAYRAMQLTRDGKKDFYLVLPQIMRQKERNAYDETLKKWSQEPNLTGFVIGQMGSFRKLIKTGKALITDFNLNVMNEESIAFWQEMGAKAVTLSVELTDEEVQGLGGAVERIVYGKVPVMTSAQCVLRGTKHCQKHNKCKQSFSLQDRKGINWPIATDCTTCMMQILSYAPLVTKPRALQQLREKMTLRLKFTDESEEEVKNVMESYLFGKPLDRSSCEGTTFKTVL